MAATALAVQRKTGLATSSSMPAAPLASFAMAPIAIVLIATVAGPVPCSGSACCTAALPAVLVLKAIRALAAQAAASSGKQALSARQQSATLGTPSYRYLSLGFLSAVFMWHSGQHICRVLWRPAGCHPKIGGWALAMIGLFQHRRSLAMVGRRTLAHEVALGRCCMRPVGWPCLFFFAPKTPAVMLIFAAVMA